MGFNTFEGNTKGKKKKIIHPLRKHTGTNNKSTELKKLKVLTRGHKILSWNMKWKPVLYEKMKIVVNHNSSQYQPTWVHMLLEEENTNTNAAKASENEI